MSEEIHIGTVYLVGAGPGDPGLLTVKGRDCLSRADVVIYDYLAEAVLEKMAPSKAERIYVGKKKGKHHLPQDRINRLLVEKARAGLTVVRLKGGDPFIFGRGGEEAFELAQAGIPFEVVPGISAGFAAAIYAGIPLTHRDYTTSMALVTGHEKPDRKVSSLEWDKLATGVGTLIFYMGMTNLQLIVDKMVENGRAPETPVAIVRWATTPQQEVLTATLETVVQKAAEAGIQPPAVIIIGEVVKMRPELRWYDNRPLFGRQFLVTRPKEGGERFAELLATEGASAVCEPTIEIVGPEDWEPVDEALTHLIDYDYLILTSVHGVEYFFDRLKTLGYDLRSLAGCAVVAVGAKTAAAIREQGVSPDLMPEDFRAEGIVALMKAQEVEGSRVLYPRAELARPLIPASLEALGARVDAPVLYRTVKPADQGDRLRQILQQREVDGVTFTSSSTVDNFCDLVGGHVADLLGDLPLISIGPLTSATLRKRGLKATIEAETSTLEGMVDAMRRYYRHRNDSPATEETDVLS